MKSFRPRAASIAGNQFRAITVAPTQVPAAATFCGAIGSGWPPIVPDPDRRALVDLWLGQRQPREAIAIGRI